jgi:hypothetical protein
MKHKYSEEQLREAISSTVSIRQALIHLGVASRGGNYKVIHKAIIQYNIDTSHFLGAAHARGKTFKPRTDTEEYLQNIKPINSYRLKRRLIKENYLKPVCSNCNNTTWLDAPIPLELDHIDGNNENNALENLRLLCPNCHALTSTYRGKNQKRARA